MTRLRSRRHAPHGPNMTPMVDVVLVILIFFMAAMGLAVREQYLRSAPPREPGASPAGAHASPTPTDRSSVPPSRTILRLTRAGRNTVVTGLGMTNVGLGDVAQRLADFAAADAADTLIVVVAPDPDVPWQDVVIVHDACAKSGVRNVRLGAVRG